MTELNLAAGARGSVTFRADADQDGSGSFTVGDFLAIATRGGGVTIEATRLAADPTGSLEIRTNGGDITINSRAGDIAFGLSLFPNTSSGSSIGGNITIAAQGDIFLSGRPLNVNSSGPLGGGAISITSNSGLVDVGHVDSSSSSGAGGEILISAADNINTGALTSSGLSRGGTVRLTSANGAIATDFATEGPPLNLIRSSSANGAGGSVTLAAATSVAVGSINARGASTSGEIALRGNEIDLTGGPNSVRSPGSNLILAPATSGQALVIAGLTDSDPPATQ